VLVLSRPIHVSRRRRGIVDAAHTDHVLHLLARRREAVANPLRCGELLRPCRSRLQGGAYGTGTFQGPCQLLREPRGRDTKWRRMPVCALDTMRPRMRALLTIPPAPYTNEFRPFSVSPCRYCDCTSWPCRGSASRSIVGQAGGKSTFLRCYWGLSSPHVLG
jgi:hypothetical protein